MVRLIFLIVLVPLLVGCADTSDSYTEPVSELTPLEQGEALYMNYCQNCHGDRGKSDGPLSELLIVRPPDLTLIAERNSDKFPADSVAAYIDGRRDTESHGSRRMPVWGNIWTDEVGGADAEQAMSAQINLLVEYIRSLQEDIPDA